MNSFKALFKVLLDAARLLRLSEDGDKIVI
jgi:hypothetical protein